MDGNVMLKAAGGRATALNRIIHRSPTMTTLRAATLAAVGRCDASAGASAQGRLTRIDGAG